VPDLIKEQKAYYQARAAEYDEWWERRGRYDLGPDGNKAWREEKEAVCRMVDALPLTGDILEFAGGTGFWTTYLARRARSVTVLDASAAMMEINRKKIEDAGLLDRVAYQRVDIFSWTPSKTYDVAFAGFWISHIPADRLDGFLAVVAAALKPGGSFVALEGQPVRSQPQKQFIRLRSEKQGTVRVDDSVEVRTLNDGSSFRIVKREIDPDDIVARLGRAGFRARCEMTARQFQLVIANKAVVE